MQSADVTATFCAALVDEWYELGVRVAFVAPGSRSTPMALAIAADSRLVVEVFHDERSAAFAALGAAKATGAAALVLCTSGTAAVNFHPAVVEASYAEVPLIVLTADRPPELQGVGAPQTIDQRQLYGSSARAFIDTGVADDERSGDWRELARRAFFAAMGSKPGPVHVNLPFREPLVGITRSLPPRDSRAPKLAKPAVVGTETLAKLAARLSGKHGLIVAGSGSPDSGSVMALAAKLRWPVIADPLGGARGDDSLAIRHADAWLRDTALASEFRPQSVLRFGALPASKVFNAWLREAGAEVTSVTASPSLIDPDRLTSMHVVADAAGLCRDLLGVVDSASPEWETKWRDAESRARSVFAQLLDDEAVLSEPGVARAVVAGLPAGSQLVVSSSMPIRDVEWYGGSCQRVRVMSNRGVNGIDGVTSTAVGAALSNRNVTGLLIGDVAFLHDTNGLLALRERAVDLRIVVVDNRGGGIFSFLPQRSALGEQRFEQLFGTPHHVDLLMLGRAHGIDTQAVTSTKELKAALKVRGPRVIVARTNRDANVAKHDDLHRAVIEAVRGAS